MRRPNPPRLPRLDALFERLSVRPLERVRREQRSFDEDGDM